MSQEDVTAIITPNSIVIQIGDVKKTYLKDNGDFSLVQYLVAKEQWSELKENVFDKTNAAKAMGVEIQDEEVVTKTGEKAHPTIETRMYDGYPNSTLEAFTVKCQANVWPSAIDDLLCFLKDKSLPITKKGTFLAWKSVTFEWLDHHSKTVDNSIGQSPKMNRAECESDRKVACGSGYHAGTYGFARGFSSGRLIIVEIDPANVSSVPLDSNEAKLRCDQYLVLEEFTSTTKNPKEYIAELAERIKGEDPEEFTSKLKKRSEAKKPEKENMSKTSKKEPTKKEITQYALHLKGSKKGDKYVAKMVQSRYPEGMEVLKEAANDPKNPQKVKADDRKILKKIVEAHSTN